MVLLAVTSEETVTQWGHPLEIDSVAGDVSSFFAELGHDFQTAGRAGRQLSVRCTGGGL